jgi:hypothetical protein
MGIYRLARIGKFRLLFSIKRFESFCKYLEVICISDCCGFDAFSFEDDDIERAVIEFDDEQLIRDISKITKAVESSNDESFKIPFLCIELTKVKFIDLLVNLLIRIDNKH